METKADWTLRERTGLMDKLTVGRSGWAVLGEL